MKAIAALLLLCVVFAAATTVTEYTYSDGQCTKDKTASASWETAKCIPVGNAPPYPSSMKVSVDGSQAVFSYFGGGECAGASYQTTNQTLGGCKYFVGSLWTNFEAK